MNSMTNSEKVPERKVFYPVTLSFFIDKMNFRQGARMWLGYKHGFDKHIMLILIGLSVLSTFTTVLGTK